MKGIEKIKRGRVDKKKSRTIILIAFGISGMAALIYAVVWTRPLSLIFGSTVYAVSTMLTAFLAGFALGSYLFRNIAVEFSSAKTIILGRDPTRVIKDINNFLGGKR